MAAAGIYVEAFIRASPERVWELTQDTSAHPRWDLRFSSITPVAELPGGGYRFEYRRAMPLHTIVGTGVSLGEASRPDGTRTSALRFDTSDRLSPLRQGRGYWRYVPVDGGTRFITGYDYEPGWGRLLDRLIVRRLIGWMTAYSFDRLRIWAETGEDPERHGPLAAIAVWRRDRPRAARCLRTPRRGSAMDDAPATLDRLEAP